MNRSEFKTQNSKLQSVAFVLCGALAREVRAIVQRHGWDVALFGVTALDHLQPQRIAPDVERRLRQLIPQYERVVVVYGDCGSGGQLDEVLARYRVRRIAGPHCYEMYAGRAFESLVEEQPGTFFLTDFLVRSFNGSVVKGLGIDRFPELKPLYFGNYTRLVYLVQDEDEQLLARAREIAAWLDLPLEVRRTGYGLLEARLIALMDDIHAECYQPILPPTDKEERDGDISDSVLARHSRSSARERRRRSAEQAAVRSLSGGGGSGGVGGGINRR